MKQYREGKVKRTPGGSEIEPETVCLQPIKAPYVGDDVLFVERANELRYVARLST